MAMFYIDDFYNINNFNGVTSVSWEICLDDTFTELVDKTYKNTEALDGWFSGLPKLNNEFGFYDEKTILYVRCKIHSEVVDEVQSDSDWFVKVFNETYDKKVKIRKHGKLVGEVSIDENNVVTNIW